MRSAPKSPGCRNACAGKFLSFCGCGHHFDQRDCQCYSMTSLDKIERAPAALAEQRRFFESHLEPSLGKFFAALAAAKGSDYYAKVAAFGAAFAELETESFSLD